MLLRCLAGAEAGGPQLYVHANRAAPRCLPCNYTDPAEDTFENPSYQYIAPRVGAPAFSIQQDTMQYDGKSLQVALQQPVIIIFLPSYMLT